MFCWFGHTAGSSRAGFLFDNTGNYVAAYRHAAATGKLNLQIVVSRYRQTKQPGNVLAQAQVLLEFYASDSKGMGLSILVAYGQTRQLGRLSAGLFRRYGENK